MSISGAAKPVVFAASLVSHSCLLSGCLPFHTDHSAGLTSAAPSTDKSTINGPTANTTTSTKMHDHCGNYDLFLEDVRPQAAPLVEVKGDFQDEAHCCNLCHQSDECMGFTFFYPTLTCKHISHKAIWAPPNANEMFIGADGYLVGMKESKVCSDCTEDTPCGRNNDEKSWWKDCEKCEDPKNWAEFPCFLPEGCKCGGELGPWYPPEPEPGCVCPDEDPDCDCGGDDEGGDDDDWHPHHLKSDMVV